MPTIENIHSEIQECLRACEDNPKKAIVEKEEWIINIGKENMLLTVVLEDSNVKYFQLKNLINNKGIEYGLEQHPQKIDYHFQDKLYF